MMLTKKRILITGTHLTPAIELIRQLKTDKKINWQVSYVGRQSNSNDIKDIAIESKIIPKLGVEYYTIPCGKLDRRYLPNTLVGIPKTISGIFKAFFLVNKIKPDIIVSFGGYVSVPLIFNAWLKKIPSITHEQTLTNSLTTKINSLFVSKIALSFDNRNQINQLPPEKIKITGNLLRYQLFQKQNSSSLKIKFKNSKLPIIFITAGNQGSHTINTTIQQLLPKLKSFNIIHQTGKNDINQFDSLSLIYPNYFASDYFETDSLTWILQNANVLISRSGANTSQEIVALGKNSILIPLPQSQQDEQILNANWVKKNIPKNTIIIPQSELTPEKLLLSIDQLTKSETKTMSTINLKPNLQLLRLIHEII